MNNDKKNNDPKTVSSFGDEWARFDQKNLLVMSMLTFLIPISISFLGNLCQTKHKDLIWDAEVVVGLL